MNKVEMPSDPKLAKQYIDNSARQKELEINAGILGKFFGTNSNIRLYIVGFIAIIILFVAFFYTLIPDSWRSQSFTVGNMWSVISPILTTIIGYLIGSNSSKDKENVE